MDRGQQRQVPDTWENDGASFREAKCLARPFLPRQQCTHLLLRVLAKVPHRPTMCIHQCGNARDLAISEPLEPSQDVVPALRLFSWLNNSLRPHTRFLEWSTSYRQLVIWSRHRRADSWPRSCQTCWNGYAAESSSGEL